MGDELVEGGEGDVSAGGELGGDVRGERGEGGVADEEHIEIAGEVFVPGAGAGEAHVRGVAGQEDVPDTFTAEEIAEFIVAFGIVNDDVVRVHGDVACDGNGEFPETGIIEARSGVEAGKLFEVIDDGFVVRERQCFDERCALIMEAAQFLVEFEGALAAFGGVRIMGERSVQFAPNGIAIAGQAEENAGDFIAQRFQEGIDDFAGMDSGEMVFSRGTEIGDAGGLGGIPALAIIDAPGMDHDESGLSGAEVIGDFDDAAGVVTPAPGADVQVGLGIIDEEGGFPTIGFADRFDPLRMIGKERFGMLDVGQFIFVGASGFPGLAQCRQ